MECSQTIVFIIVQVRTCMYNVLLLTCTLYNVRVHIHACILVHSVMNLTVFTKNIYFGQMYTWNCIVISSDGFVLEFITAM